MYLVLLMEDAQKSLYVTDVMCSYISSLHTASNHSYICNFRFMYDQSWTNALQA